MPKDRCGGAGRLQDQGDVLPFECGSFDLSWSTVDGQNPASPSMMNYPIIYRVLTIPGGAGFISSTVSWSTLSTQIICNSMWDLRLGAIEWRDLLQEELDNGQTTCWMWLKWCKGRLTVWWVYVSILLVGTVWGAINSRHFKSVQFSWGRWILMWLGTRMQSTSLSWMARAAKGLCRTSSQTASMM